MHHCIKGLLNIPKGEDGRIVMGIDSLEACATLRIWSYMFTTLLRNPLCLVGRKLCSLKFLCEVWR